MDSAKKLQVCREQNIRQCLFLLQLYFYVDINTPVFKLILILTIRMHTGGFTVDHIWKYINLYIFFCQM